MNELQKDGVDVKIQVFSIGSGKTITLGAYTPTTDEVITLGDAVDIDVDGVSFEYAKGRTIGLRKGITYTFSSIVFSTPIPVHLM